jgi:hypothetical protein
MLKLLLLAVALLLLVSIAGDVLFVHHHLDSASIETHHLTQYALTFGLVSTLYLCAQSGLFRRNSRINLISDNSSRHFCGWHNSAYLEEKTIFSFL